MFLDTNYMKCSTSPSNEKQQEGADVHISKVCSSSMVIFTHTSQHLSDFTWLTKDTPTPQEAPTAEEMENMLTSLALLPAETASGEGDWTAASYQNQHDY